MPKGESHTRNSFKINQLERILRGTEFRTLSDLADLLKVNIRSIQRYMKNWSENKYNFQVNNEKKKGFRIFDPDSSGLPTFTEDEIFKLWNHFLEQNMLSEDLKDKLIKTVSLRIEDTGKFKTEIFEIKKAIKDKKKIRIQEYYSREHHLTHLKEITPVYLNIDTKKVFAFNPIEKKIYTYNLENMYGVKKTSIPSDDYFNLSFKKDELDIFGFRFNNKKINVQLLLTAFARSQLIRQFPKIDELITDIGNSHDSFRLKITVHDIQPIARFVTGLFNEVKIEGNNEAKELIKKYYSEMVKKGFEKNFPINNF